MPIIEASGYFGGDRFDLVSDEARMIWPSFFLASNSVGRIELNYAKVVALAFSRWKRKPTEKQFWSYMQEYQDAFLLFIYEDHGQVWGQWDTDEKFLPRHKLAADLRSPAPIVRDYQEWRSEYISKKAAKSNPISNLKFFRKVSQNSEEFCGNVRGGGVGVGGGVVDGKVEEKADAPQASPPPPIPISAKGARFTLRPLDPAWLDWATKKRGWDAVRADEVYESFTDYWISKGGPGAIKADWFATWRNWCRNEKTTTKARDSPKRHRDDPPPAALLWGSGDVISGAELIRQMEEK